MFELLAAVLNDNQITMYAVHQFQTLNECVLASVQMAQQVTDQTVTFICAKSI